MGNDLDALLDEVPDDVASPEGTEEAAGTESAAAAEKLAELDAIIPTDAQDIDEDFRGKPLSEVLRVATQHKHEIGVARKKNQDYNVLETRARVAEDMLSWLRQQIADQSRPPAQPEAQETDQDLLDALAQHPTKVLPAKIAEQVEPLQRQLNVLLERNVRLAADAAREQARSALNIRPDVWEQITPQLASITAARRQNIEDPRAWYDAAYEYISTAQYFAPQQQAPVVVPQPAAPSSGAAKSTARPTTTARLRGRDEQTANDFLAAFNIKADSPRAAEFKTYMANRQQRGEEE